MDAVRSLFQEYEAAIGVDLCFQGFADELAALPGKYSRPSGFILLAERGEPMGCIALRPASAEACEMKRLFVKPECQGLGLGRRLAEACVAEATKIGYKSMRLDTLAHMHSAIALYRSLGFEERDAYYDNPQEGVHYMERKLG
jgi:ribosomal protein S18 acetylase RimI-like enzyme